MRRLWSMFLHFILVLAVCPVSTHLGINLTRGSIITVPCPGADPLETWSRDALVENYFGAPSMRSSTRNSDLRDSRTSGATGNSQKTCHNDKAAPSSWVRQGIRKEASTARVLMYEHREVVDGTTLNVLAEDLLREVLEIRLMQVSTSFSTPIIRLWRS